MPLMIATFGFNSKLHYLSTYCMFKISIMETHISFDSLVVCATESSLDLPLVFFIVVIFFKIY